MKLDISIVFLLLCAGLFYLKIALVQRAHARQAKSTTRRGKKGSQSKSAVQSNPNVYNILSDRPLDWVIGGLGAALMVLGILLKLDTLEIDLFDANANWWIPLGVGMVAFSFGFR